MTRPSLHTDKTTDIWFLGHIVYELLTFTTLDSRTIYKKVNPMSKSDKNDKRIYLDQIYQTYAFYQTGTKFKTEAAAKAEEAAKAEAEAAAKADAEAAAKAEAKAAAKEAAEAEAEAKAEAAAKAEAEAADNKQHKYHKKAQ